MNDTFIKEKLANGQTVHELYTDDWVASSTKARQEILSALHL